MGKLTNLPQTDKAKPVIIYNCGIWGLVFCYIDIHCVRGLQLNNLFCVHELVSFALCVCICWFCMLLCGGTMSKLSEYPDKVFPAMLRTGHPECEVWLHRFWRHGKLYCEICQRLTSIPEFIFYHWSVSWLPKRWGKKAKLILLLWCRYFSVSVVLMFLFTSSSAGKAVAYRI